MGAHHRNDPRLLTSDTVLALAVPFTDVHSAALESVALDLERCTTAVEAVQRLIEKALEARAHRDAA